MAETNEMIPPLEQCPKTAELFLKNAYLLIRKRYEDLPRPKNPGETFSPEKIQAQKKMREAWKKFVQTVSANRKKQITDRHNEVVTEGQYDLTISYLDRSGTIKTQKISDSVFFPQTTGDRLAAWAFQNLEMYGVHNFKLKFTDELSVALIDLMVVKNNDPRFPPIQLSTWVDRGGHLVNESTAD